MNRLKNQHLLAIIALLSGVGTLLGMMLIMSERRNGQQIDVLTRQLVDAEQQFAANKQHVADALRQREEAESAIMARIGELRGDQMEARRQQDEVAAGLQKKLGSLDKDLGPVRRQIQTLEQEHVEFRGVFVQIAKSIDALNKRLIALESPPKKPLKEPK